MYLSSLIYLYYRPLVHSLLCKFNLFYKKCSLYNITVLKSLIHIRLKIVGRFVIPLLFSSLQKAYHFIKKKKELVLQCFCNNRFYERHRRHKLFFNNRMNIFVQPLARFPTKVPKIFRHDASGEPTKRISW